MNYRLKLKSNFKYISFCINDIDSIELTKDWCHIYEIRNLITNQFYIGSCFNFKKRVREHLNSLRKNKHRNQYLQNSWNKYGIENFKFTIHVSLLSKENLLEIEQNYLDRYFTFFSNRLFNLNRYVDGGFRNRKHTDETKRLMSIKSLGKKGTVFGENHSTSKLNNDQVYEIRKMYKLGGYSYAELGRIYNVTYQTIREIILNKIWKHI